MGFVFLVAIINYDSTRPKYVLAVEPDGADRADAAIASTAENSLNYMSIPKL